jgi:hypothetical protein
MILHFFLNFLAKNYFMTFITKEARCWRVRAIYPWQSLPGVINFFVEELEKSGKTDVELIEIKRIK